MSGRLGFRSSRLRGSGSGLGLFRAEVVHAGLIGVREEQAVEFLGCRPEEVTVAGGMEGLKDKGGVGGVLGDAGAVGVAMVRQSALLGMRRPSASTLGRMRRGLVPKER